MNLVRISPLTPRLRDRCYGGGREPRAVVGAARPLESRRVAVAPLAEEETKVLNGGLTPIRHLVFNLGSLPR